MCFELKIQKLYWINGDAYDPDDLCLNGDVFVKIGNKVLDNDKDGWTVSAGAYRMLQSLYRDHMAGNEQHLLPCCGHFMFVDEETDQLIISGCPNGLDWSVMHENGMVRLMADANNQIIIPFNEYKDIVFKFADEIKAYYDKCTPKKPKQDDFENKAYERFWSDWEKLRHSNL